MCISLSTVQDHLSVTKHNDGSCQGEGAALLVAELVAEPGRISSGTDTVAVLGPDDRTALHYLGGRHYLTYIATGMGGIIQYVAGELVADLGGSVVGNGFVCSSVFGE